MSVNIIDFRDECKNLDTFYWSYISQFGDLTTEHLREWTNKLDWKQLSMSYRFTENELDEFSNYVYWPCISLYQNLTESVLKKFSDRIDWSEYSRNEFITEQIAKKYWDKLNKRFLVQHVTKFSYPFIKTILNYIDKKDKKLK